MEFNELKALRDEEIPAVLGHGGGGGSQVIVGAISGAGGNRHIVDEPRRVGPTQIFSGGTESSKGKLETVTGAVNGVPATLKVYSKGGWKEI